MNRVFLVAPPRSGAALLQRCLASAGGWRIPGHPAISRIDGIPGMPVAERGFTTHRLTGADLSDDVRAALSVEPGSDIVVDWSPRNALSLSMLAEALPDAKFIVMSRRPAMAIASLWEAWVSGRFVSVPNLPDWWGEPWSFPLIEGWRDLIGAPVAHVAAAQWAGITSALLDDLSSLTADQWTVASYDELVDDPKRETARVAEALGLPWSADLSDPLPLTSTTVSPPDPGKWRRSWSEVGDALTEIGDVGSQLLSALVAHRPDLVWPDPDAGETGPKVPEVRSSAGTAFSSSHTSSFAEILMHAGASVIITTYKSGHVILARSAGTTINTEFTNMPRPMGIAASGNRLAIGTDDAIVSFCLHSGLAATVPSAVPTDAPYAHQATVRTGDIAVHDMAYDLEGELAFVNTRFSCLCRQDINHSFVPFWRPSWISQLADDDRCHLNGLAVVNGRPKFVTALAKTDTPHGWREMRGTGGLIIDVETDRIVAEGLSMPHSPRWHEGRLWVLESGKGTLSSVDIATGHLDVVAQLPGFTRGLSFIGPYALVGLSQVRESVFASLPITQTKDERNCGVWMVDIRSGHTAGWLKFDGVVQEIFEVAALPYRWPVIVEDAPLTRNAFVLPDETLSEVLAGQAKGAKS